MLHRQFEHLKAKIHNPSPADDGLLLTWQQRMTYTCCDCVTMQTCSPGCCRNKQYPETPKAFLRGLLQGLLQLLLTLKYAAGSLNASQGTFVSVADPQTPT